MAFKKNSSTLSLYFTCQIDLSSMMYEYKHNINELDDDTIDLDKLISRQLFLFVVLSLNGAVPKRIVSLFVFFLFLLFLSFSLVLFFSSYYFFLSLFKIITLHSLCFDFFGNVLLKNNTYIYI
jgi:hypothetical protein